MTKILLKQTAAGDRMSHHLRHDIKGHLLTEKQFFYKNKKYDPYRLCSSHSV